MLFFLLLQAAAAQAPDIQFNANVRARSVTIEKQGNASLTVTTSPEGGNVVDVRAPKANGRKSLRNVEVNVRAEGRIGDPSTAAANNQNQAETAPPQ
jgi:hypothetical protein